eukprot:4021494-Ditylum_brightwellii.AAC.1
MKYHMSTEKGVSEEFIYHSDNHPCYGTRQGTTDFSPKWNFNNNIIAKAYGKKAYGCRVHDPT